MSSMGMQVELSMTAKGVQATLKDAQGAIVQTASIIKTQLPNATDEASKGLSKFKEGLGRSRETMMFFTQSLGELGPGGRTAQMALSGLGGMLMGGGVVGLGLAAAQVGTRLLADYLGQEAKAAEEAKKKNDQVFEKLKSDAQAAAKAVQDFNAKARGVSGEDAGLAANAAALNPHIAKAKAEADAKRAILAGLQGQQDAGRAYAGQQADIDAAAEAVRVAEAAHADLLEKQKAFEERRKQLSMTASVEIENARRAADDEAERERDQKAKERAEKEKSDYERKYQLYYAHLDRLARAKEKKDEEADKKQQKHDVEGQAALDKRARNYEANLKKIATDAEKVRAEWAAAGSTISSAFGDIGNIIGGAAQSWMQYFGQLIQKAIQLAIAMSATAGPFGWLNAAAAGIALISAVTSVPEFRAMGGPVTAGAPYIVGERGPELFVPGQSGGIVPNHAMGGGNITLHFHSPDAQGVRRLLLDNTSALSEAIGKAIRDGRRFG